MKTVCGIVLSTHKPDDALGQAMVSLGITQALCATFEGNGIYPAPIIQTLAYLQHLEGADLGEQDVSDRADTLCTEIAFAPADRVIFDQIPTALMKAVYERTKHIPGVCYYHVLRADGVFQEIREGILPEAAE